MSESNPPAQPGPVSASPDTAASPAAPPTATPAESSPVHDVFSLFKQATVKVAAPTFQPENLSEDDKSTAFLAFAGAGITLCILPLVLYLVKHNDASPFLKDQLAEALNWGISVTVVLVVIGLMGTILMVISPLLAIPLNIGLMGIYVYAAVFSIKLASQAKAGVAQRYPANLRLVK